MTCDTCGKPLDQPGELRLSCAGRHGIVGFGTVPDDGQVCPDCHARTASVTHRVKCTEGTAT
jgi:hypothetical protein